MPEPVPDEMMEVMDFAPGAVMAGTPHLPGTREFFTCLDGRVNLMVAGERHALAAGDVLAFPGNLPHSYQNADAPRRRAASRSSCSPRPASDGEWTRGGGILGQSSYCIYNYFVKRSCMNGPAGQRIADQIARECLMTRWRMVNCKLTAIYDEELRPFHLRSSQLSLLVALTKAGPIRRIQLGRYFALDPSTLTRNLRVMLKQGWIWEVPDTSDRRGQPLEVTAKGRKLLDSIGTCLGACPGPRQERSARRPRSLSCP